MKIILALATMLAINMFLFLGQVGVDEIAGGIGVSAGTTLYNGTGGLIESYRNDNDYNLKLTTQNDLPAVAGGIDAENNNFLTDAIATIKSWFSSAGRGWDYFGNIVNAVPQFLKSIGLPPPISFALGFFWNALTLFLVIMLVWGRQL